MHKRIIEMKKLLAEENIKLHTYRYGSGECSCCYGPEIPEGQMYCVIDLNVTSNQGTYDRMGSSKSYFTQQGVLKHKNFIGFGIRSVRDDEELLRIGKAVLHSATKAGFKATWEGGVYKCVVLLPDDEAKRKH